MGHNPLCRHRTALKLLHNVIETVSTLQSEIQPVTVLNGVLIK
jgi:hypothetical protein